MINDIYITEDENGNLYLLVVPYGMPGMHSDPKWVAVEYIATLHTEQAINLLSWSYKLSTLPGRAGFLSYIGVMVRDGDLSEGQAKQLRRLLAG